MAFVHPDTSPIMMLQIRKNCKPDKSHVNVIRWCAIHTLIPRPFIIYIQNWVVAEADAWAVLPIKIVDSAYLFAARAVIILNNQTDVV